MKDKDKLAEEILNKYLSPEFLCDNSIEGGAWLTEPIYEAMQAYHEAKMKEVTDADIEVWAEKEFGDSMVIPEIAAMAGAKAMRDGEIVSSNRNITI